MDVTLVLTHDCNLGCGYCYAGRKFASAMPREVARRAIDLAFAAPSPRVEISYFGGEPLLAWDVLVETAELAKKRAAEANVTLAQSVTTNGTLLDDERVAKLGELGVYVALSIDGNRAAHEANRPKMGGGSSFDDVSRARDKLVAAQRAFETISVITPASAPELGASVAELFARGVPRVTLNPCYEAAWTDADIDVWGRGLEQACFEVMQWMRRGRVVSLTAIDNKIRARLQGGLRADDRCPVGHGAVAVAPSGNLYPCERMVGEDEDTRFVVGHLDTGIDLLRVAGTHSPEPDRHATNSECNGCGERARCSAACACANLAETGSTSVAGGVQCWYEQAIARLADSLLEQLAKERNEAFGRWFFPGGFPRTLQEGPAAPHAVARTRRLPIAG